MRRTMAAEANAELVAAHEAAHRTATLCQQSDRRVGRVGHAERSEGEALREAHRGDGLHMVRRRRWTHAMRHHRRWWRTHAMWSHAGWTHAVAHHLHAAAPAAASLAPVLLLLPPLATCLLWVGIIARGRGAGAGAGTTGGRRRAR